MILTFYKKMPKNVGDLGKLIVAKGFKKLPKVQKIARSGHTVIPPLGKFHHTFWLNWHLVNLSEVPIKMARNRFLRSKRLNWQEIDLLQEHIDIKELLLVNRTRSTWMVELDVWSAIWLNLFPFFDLLPVKLVFWGVGVPITSPLSYVKTFSIVTNYSTMNSKTCKTTER